MNRNLRSELLTAIFVIAGILIAIGAIIALSSSSDTAVPDITPTTISMVESPVDNRSTATVADMTAQIVPVDVDKTEIVTSEIPLSTEPTDDVGSISATTLPSTNTEIDEMPTVFASETPPLPTRTPRLTNTPRPTHTEIGETPTALASNTPIPPSRTPRLTNTPRPIHTAIPSATYTPTNIPTETPIPPSRTPRPSSTPITSDVLVVEGCLNPSIQITSPRPNDRLSDVFDVVGTATLPNFGLYRIEIRPHDALTYQRIRAIQQVVYADVLAQINPSDYPSGVYWIRLVVVDNRGAIAENGTCAIPTIFE